MTIITQDHLSPLQKEAALRIWNKEYPQRLVMSAMEPFDEFLDSITDKTHYLLLTGHREIAGWAAAFMAGPVRSFFIMVDGSYQGKGYGTLLLNQIKKDNHKLFAWAIDHDQDFKLDGTRYPSPIAFYLKNGFTVNNDLRLENELLSAVNILWQKG
ncbi:MAG TPA: GNAT family N-acetyltransferase [Mucilaginibacter sp.]|nr:GNAT family N-acetyltransferase [Mucilaginibacter sp.]